MVKTEHKFNWIEKRRKGLGISREKLARASGISDVQLYRIEHGITVDPRFSTLEKLNEVLSGVEDSRKKEQKDGES